MGKECLPSSKLSNTKDRMSHLIRDTADLTKVYKLVSVLDIREHE